MEPACSHRAIAAEQPKWSPVPRAENAAISCGITSFAAPTPTRTNATRPGSSASSPSVGAVTTSSSAHAATAWPNRLSPSFGGAITATGADRGGASMAAGASAAAPAAGSSDPTPIAIAAAAVVITTTHTDAIAPLPHRFIASRLCLLALA